MIFSPQLLEPAHDAHGLRALRCTTKLLCLGVRASSLTLSFAASYFLSLQKVFMSSAREGPHLLSMLALCFGHAGLAPGENQRSGWKARRFPAGTVWLTGKFGLDHLQANVDNNRHTQPARDSGALAQLTWVPYFIFHII